MPGVCSSEASLSQWQGTLSTHGEQEENVVLPGSNVSTGQTAQEPNLLMKGPLLGHMACLVQFRELKQPSRHGRVCSEILLYFPSRVSFTASTQCNELFCIYCIRRGIFGRRVKGQGEKDSPRF